MPVISHLVSLLRRSTAGFPGLLGPSVLALSGSIWLGDFTTPPNCCSRELSASGAATDDLQLVKVITKREGAVTRFFLDNRESCEVTMTFDFATVNLKGTVPFPYTRSFPPRKVTEAFALEPEESGQKWSYSYTNYYKLGDNLARHDDTIFYKLPYAVGSQFKVTQAYGGSYSHKGSNKYAIDWKMPEGTPVLASRGGEVVKTKDDSIKGGPSMTFDRYNNFVLIRHSDGTLGHYCHLLKDSVKVKVGDRVGTGQLLAQSGNTGFSSGPHLHFCVFATRSGKERVSIPIKFWAGGIASDLVAGRNYRATLEHGKNTGAAIQVETQGTAPAVTDEGS